MAEVRRGPARGRASLRRQLLQSLLALVLPLLLMSPVSLALMAASDDAHRHVAERTTIATEVTDQQTRVAALTESLTVRPLVDGDPAALQAFARRSLAVDDGFSRLLPHLRGDERARALEAQDVWHELAAGLVALPPQLPTFVTDSGALRTALDRIGRQLMRMVQSLDEAAAANAVRLRAELDSAHRATARQLELLVGLGVLGLLGAVVTAGRLHRRIAAPLAALRDAAQRLGDDDLPERVEVDRAPELGDLAAAFNAMTDRLSASRSLLLAREQRFRALVRHSSDLVTVLDESGTVTWAADSAEPVLGVSGEELLGLRLLDQVHPDDRPRVAAVLDSALRSPDAQPEMATARLRWSGSASARHAEGYVHVELVLQDLRGLPAVGGLVLTAHDVTEQTRLHEQLRHQAFHDELTGLPNRALFTDRVNHALSGRESRPPAVLYCDLDAFKAVNDTQGHAAGDELLLAVARRLAAAVRPVDTVARLGGDEFAVLLDSVTAEEAVQTARRLLVDVCEPVLLAGHGSVEVLPSMSVGVAVTAGGSSARDAEELLSQADAAMYQAKLRTDSSAAVVLFDAALGGDLLARLELRGDLQRAVRDEQFRLVYQPTVELATGVITGVEALVRWEHPVRGTVSPVDFIPLAEETGLIVALGLWVLETACRQVRAWLDAQPGLALHLSVNLSVRQLEQASIVDDVASVLALTGLDPGRLTLELTESVLLDHSSHVLERMHALRGLGVQLAIDDFGTGYSSLSYLQRLPVDVLKIDKSFVDVLADVQPGGADEALAGAIVGLARTLGLHSIAEGIEHPSQAAALRELGCVVGQGYLFARPLPPDQLADLLRDETRLHVADVPDQANSA